MTSQLRSGQHQASDVGILLLYYLEGRHCHLHHWVTPGARHTPHNVHSDTLVKQMPSGIKEISLFSCLGQLVLTVCVCVHIELGRTIPTQARGSQSLSKSS